MLRDVSRSFYLTLRLLPKHSRDVISLGYLMARATDTIADASGVSIMERQLLLEKTAELMAEDEPSKYDLEKLIAEIQEEVLPELTKSGEITLMRKLSDCFGWLSTFGGRKRQALDRVLETIVKGQLMDLETFGKSDAGDVTCLDKADQLHLYTDLVAGCVGRFWTEVGFACDEQFASSPESEMLKLGEDYGRGLQLVNIVRDLGEDLEAGRCYFPLEELVVSGWQDGHWKHSQAAILEVADHWMKKAENGLRGGVRYAQFTRNRRVKIATVLPALVGALTLRQLRKAQGSYLFQRLKVSRAEIRQILFRTMSLGTLGGQVR